MDTHAHGSSDRRRLEAQAMRDYHEAHAPTLEVGPSGVRAECSCGWGGMPRYTDAQAWTDHAQHLAP